MSEAKTHPRPSPLASLFLSTALCGLLAVPKSFQSKCKFHQPPSKKTDISIKANVLRLCRVDVSLSIASPVRKPANLPPLLRIDLSFLSLFSSFSLFVLLFSSPPLSPSSLSSTLYGLHFFFLATLIPRFSLNSTLLHPHIFGLI